MDHPLSFSVFFLNFTKRRTGTLTETSGSNILARLDPRPAEVRVEKVGVPQHLNTGILQSMVPAFNKLVWLLCRDWMFNRKRGRGLVSYSSCRLEEIRSRHPDTQGPLQTHALGWSLLSGLLLLQSNLGRKRKGAKKVFGGMMMTINAWVHLFLKSTSQRKSQRRLDSQNYLCSCLDTVLSL